MLILHFDYTSLPSAVAVLRFARMSRADAEVVVQGIDVLGLATAVPVTIDQRDEMTRWRERACEVGLHVHTPTLRSATLDAHLVGEVAETSGVGESWRETVLRAYWEEGADIGRSDVLCRLAGHVGLDLDRVAATLDDASARAELRRRMAADRRRGLGGVPVLEFDGTFVSAELDDADAAALLRL